MDCNFCRAFKDLTGNEPLSWQRRLYEQWSDNNLKPVIDLPTGMGKTMVMAIWLLAREKNPALGRRLIYVVDRRTVVDQATNLAEQLVEKSKSAGIQTPSISTLRGQLAEDREWTKDPSKPAIIIGTVDMIGSRLLFSGYRSSYKQRPLDAGFLGQDSLLVLDEAHLSKPFEKLVRDICDKGRFQAGQGSPMRVVRMSATTSANDENPFTLIDNDLKGDRETNPIVRRFEAEKHLTITPDIEKSNLNDALCEAATKLANDNSRVVVFVGSPDDATKIDGKIRDHEKTKNQPGSFANAVEVLTGTMRGLERDELLKKPVMRRFLDPDNRPIEGPAILVSTSAGEVGFDLNADHLVCDAAPLDSMIQRLGRVNRRGDGIEATAAQVRVFVAKPDEKKTAGADTKKDKHTFESASIASMAALSKLPKLSNGANDARPRAFRNLDKPAEALSPDPTMVDLTDILLDAWSMTSITEPMPGRPEVAPWLRGIDDNLPQTTIAWRAELDIDGFDQLDSEDIEEWFDTHRILTHETLSVPTSVAAKWFLERWHALDPQLREKTADRSCIADRAGLRKIKLSQLMSELQRKPANTDSIRNADVILPASFGGIERQAGLLDSSAPRKPEDADDETRKHNEAARCAAPDVADIRGRYRELITTTEGGEPDRRPIGSGTMPANPARFILDLESDDDARLQLVSYVPKLEKPEWGTKEQSLTDHVKCVKECAMAIASRLPELSDAERQAVSLAAEFHDHGKNRKCWQRLVRGTATPAGQDWSVQTLGKSGGNMLRDSRGYRHEFGSLRELDDTFNGGKLLDDAGKPINQDVFDLAMHLIATHHGRGRPHFPKGGFDPDVESRSNKIHTDAIRRFARLQRQYGHWQLAWLENLLRCADAAASAGIEMDDDADDTNGGEA